jgi:hypothetical protein
MAEAEELIDPEEYAAAWVSPGTGGAVVYANGLEKGVDDEKVVVAAEGRNVQTTGLVEVREHQETPDVLARDAPVDEVEVEVMPCPRTVLMTLGLVGAPCLCYYSFSTTS